MIAEIFKHLIRRCYILLPLTLVVGLPVNSQIVPDAPIEGITVTMFSNEGYKQWNLRGSSAAYTDSGGVEVQDLDLEVFQGSDGEEMDMHIKGAQALYESSDRTVKGKGGVIVNGDFYDIEGETWNYSQDDRIVKVNSNVKVVIDYELEEFLK